MIYWVIALLIACWLIVKQSQKSNIYIVQVQMPHIIRRVGKGKYKVADATPMPNGRYRYYSKDPMTREEAHKQLVAINLSLIRKGEKVSWK